MKKKTIGTIITVTAILILILGAAAVYYNSDYYYSKKLCSAIQNCDISEVKQIIDKKPEAINKIPTILPEWFYIIADVPHPVNALYQACDTDNVELVETLINAGANVDGEGLAVPLSLVYLNKKENWIEISELLIQNGASLNYTTHYSGGKSAILQDIVQARPGSELPGYVPENEDEVIQAFNYALENCDHKNVDWARVLQSSVSNDRMEITKHLLGEGLCDVNYTDDSHDMTALMFAARNSTPQMVELLLDAGADPEIKDKDGKTAYDFAVQFNNKDVIAIL